MPPGDNTQSNGKKEIVATYDYQDEQNNLLFQVVRYYPKDFRQRKPTIGGWDWSIKGARVAPYRLHKLLQHLDRHVVVEGEKDVLRLSSIGVIATCNAGGAGKWTTEHAQFLRGRKVVVIPDNDEPGRKHARQVAKSLKGLATSIKVVELPGLPAKGDVSDWIDAGGTVDQLKALVESAAEWVETTSDKEPAALLEPPAPYVPFPIECLPEPVRSFVLGGSKSIGCDPSFIALPVLSMVAAAIGNSRRLCIKRGWIEP